MNKILYIIIFLGVLIGGYFLITSQSQPDKSARTEQINEKIKVVMYSASYCKYCTMAKQELKKAGLRINEIDIANDQEQAKVLVQKTGQASIPQIFINGTHIGGYSELMQLKNSGKLQRFLVSFNMSDLK